MQHTQLLDLVRQQVRVTFQSQGSPILGDWCETILIRDGFYCGRRFTAENRRAIWFHEEQVIKFYGPDGDFLSSCATDDLGHRLSAAA